jgi:hypothetical protein
MLNNFLSGAEPQLPGFMEEALRAARGERDQFYPGCDAVFALEGRRITNSRRSWETASEKVAGGRTAFP